MNKQDFLAKLAIAANLAKVANHFEELGEEVKTANGKLSIAKVEKLLPTDSAALDELNDVIFGTTTPVVVNKPRAESVRVGVVGLMVYPEPVDRATQRIDPDTNQPIMRQVHAALSIEKNALLDTTVLEITGTQLNHLFNTVYPRKSERVDIDNTDTDKWFDLQEVVNEDRKCQAAVSYVKINKGDKYHIGSDEFEHTKSYTKTSPVMLFVSGDAKQKFQDRIDSREINLLKKEQLSASLQS